MKSRVFAAITVLAIIMSMAPQSFAASSAGDVITSEEFHSALIEEYANHNIGFEVVDYGDDTFVFTQQLLDEELEKIRNNSNQFSERDFTVQPEVIDKFDLLNSSPRAMYVDKVHKVIKRIDNDGGYCDVQLAITALVNVQNEQFVEISSVSSFQNGVAHNLILLSSTGNTLEISYDRRTINGYVQMNLVTEFTSSWAGTYRYSTYHNINVNWNLL